MKIIKLIILFCAFCFSINAQDLNLDNLSNVSEFDLEACEILNNSNQAFVSLLGESNSIISIQQNLREYSNQILSDQHGIKNSVYINQSGIAHATDVFQFGNENEANSWSVGSSTLTVIQQNGNDNRINSYIENQELFPKAVSIQQSGNTNSVDLALIGSGFLTEGWPKAAVISQNGNNLEFSAKLESFNSPIYVEQQSGPTGGGMKIDISNSDFYFPMK